MSDELSRKERIEELAEEYLDSKLRGESPQLENYLEAHPELASDLKRRISVIEFLRKGSSELPPIAQPESIHEYSCPNCEQIIDLEGNPSSLIDCPNCGQAFTVASRHRVSLGHYQVPSQISKFDILHTLGKGAFGVVYLGRDRELQREVAIKIPRQGKLVHDDDIERFLREARSSAKLRHPNIVQVYDSGCFDETPYIVSEFIEGETLAERLSKSRPSFKQVAEWIREIALALDYAHSERVTHRDLKPANILLDANGKPHISDFGLARLEGEDVTVTLDGELLGTPAYMAPEQAKGEHNQVNASSDIYSLGVILYEMLCHERPFRGSRTMLVYQVLYEEPRKPRSLNDHIPKDLETICIKAIEKDPTRRYATAGELAFDIKRFLNGEPIQARPVGNLERVWRWAKRKPLVAGLILLAASLFVAFITATINLNIEAENSKRQTAQESARLMIAEAARYIENDDAVSALPRIAEAFKNEENDPERALIHQFRFECVLQRLPKLVQQWNFDSPIYSVSISPNNKNIAISTWERKVHIRGLEESENKATLTLGDRPSHFQFSPDGNHFITYNMGSPLVVGSCYPFKIHKQIKELSPVTSATFDSQGKHILGSGLKGDLLVWELNTLKVVSQRKVAGPIHASLFSSDDQLIATVTRNNLLDVWDWKNSKEAYPTRKIDTGGEQLWYLKFHPKKNKVLIGGASSYVALVDLESGVIQRVSEKHKIRGFEFSPGGQQFLVHGIRREITVRSSESGRILFNPLEPYKSGRFACFTQDSNFLISSNIEGRVNTLSAWSGSSVFYSKLWSPTAVSAIATSKRKRYLVTGDDTGLVRVWDYASTATPFIPLTQIGYSGKFKKVEYSPDGSQVAVAGTYRQVLLHDTNNGNVSKGLVHIPGTVFAEFDPTGTYLATIDNKNIARVWRVEDEKLMVSKIDGAGRVKRICFNASGTRILAGTQSGKIKVIDIETGKELSPWKVHGKRAISGVAFSPDGTTCASVDEVATLIIWDANTLKPITPIIDETEGREETYTSVIYSPSGDYLVTCGKSGKAQFWNPLNGEKVKSFYHSPMLKYALFSDDEKFLTTFGSDHITRIWNLETDELWLDDLRHKGGVIDIDFDKQGRWIATIGYDGYHKLWDRKTGELVNYPFSMGRAGVSIAFNPRGHQIAFCNYEGPPLLWNLPQRYRSPENLVKIANLLSTQKMNSIRGETRLNRHQLMSLWEELKSKENDLFTTSKEDVLAWHRRELIQSEKENRWADAVYHVQPLVEAYPDHKGYLLRQSKAILNRGIFSPTQLKN